MKTYSVHITAAAKRDVINAVNHIDIVLKNPIAADALLDAFENQVNELSSFPERYPPVHDSLLSAWGIRFAAVKNYLVLYIVDEQKSLVQIIRFVYAKSNWISVLKGGFTV